MTDRYVVTDRPGSSRDVVHRNPGEACNLDDSTRDEEVDAATATGLVNRGLADPCGHCNPGPHTAPAVPSGEEDS